jgi:hypothetical protein
MVRPAPLRTSVLLALAVLAGLAGAAVHWGARTAPQRSKECMDDWDVRDLAGYLEGRGLKLHLSPTSASANVSANAFLTTTEKPATELYGLVKDTNAMQPWAGVVYCERLRDPEDRQLVLECWADCGLRADPFVFFGDPELLARIRTALGDAISSSRQSCDP